MSWALPWWLGGLVANVFIQCVEYLNRHHGEPDDNFLDQLWVTWPLILVAQYGLWCSFRGAPHWLLAWGVFTVGNAVMRLGLVGLTGQPITSWGYVTFGVSLILLGGLVMKEGLA